MKHVSVAMKDACDLPWLMMDCKLNYRICMRRVWGLDEERLPCVELCWVFPNCLLQNQEQQKLIFLIPSSTYIWCYRKEFQQHSIVYINWSIKINITFNLIDIKALKPKILISFFSWKFENCLLLLMWLILEYNAQYYNSSCKSHL